MIQEQLFFEQEIIRIKEEYGTQYFSKSGFHAVLKDLSPHIERKYFTVLKFADDFGLYKKIKVITATDESTKVITIENLKHQFIDESGLDITVANSVFWAFLFGNSVTDIQTVINDASNQPTINIEDNKSIRTVSEKSLPFVEKKSNGDFESVTIGKQVWMAKNLNIDTFRNSDPIPHITSDKEWEEYGEQGKPAWCYYYNDSANAEKYGKLYNWHAVNDSRGLAPKGWKIPSNEDWDCLIEFLGGEVVAGTKMKSSNGWQDYKRKSGNGTNQSGFSGLPSGYRDNIGNFFLLTKSGKWWISPKEDENLFDRIISLSHRYTALVKNWGVSKIQGVAIRCIKNIQVNQTMTVGIKSKITSQELDDKRFVQKNSRSINRSNNQKLSNSDLNEIKAYYSNVVGGLGSAVLRRDFEQRWQVFTQWYTKNQTSAFFEFGNWIKRALQVNSVYRVHLNVAKTLATSWKKKNKTVNVEAFEMAIGLCL